MLDSHVELILETKTACDDVRRRLIELLTEEERGGADVADIGLLKKSYKVTTVIDVWKEVRSLRSGVGPAACAVGRACYPSLRLLLAAGLGYGSSCADEL